MFSFILNGALGLFGSLIGKFYRQLVIGGLIAIGLLLVYSAGGDAERVAQLEKEAAAERAARRALVVRLEQRNEQIDKLKREHEAIDEEPTIASGAGAQCRIDGEFVRQVLGAYNDGTS